MKFINTPILACWSSGGTKLPSAAALLPGEYRFMRGCR